MVTFGIKSFGLLFGKDQTAFWVSSNPICYNCQPHVVMLRIEMQYGFSLFN